MTQEQILLKIYDALRRIGDLLERERGQFVDRPTKPHKFMPSRTVGECGGCIYPEDHPLHYKD